MTRDVTTLDVQGH